MGANGRGQFFIFFHELGHAVDYYAGQDNGYSGFFTENYTVNGLNLSGYNEKDVKTMLGKSLDEILVNGNYENADQIKMTVTDALYDPKVDSENSLTGDSKDVYNKLYNEYNKKNFSDVTSFGSADVYHGITNYDILGKLIGHPQENYYFYDENNIPKHPTGKENFGTYFSYNMISGNSGKDHLEDYLPESANYMEIALEEMR